MTAKDRTTFEFWNDSVLYLLLLAPMLFYILAISIISIRRKNKYARYLLVGISFVLITSIRDIYHVVISDFPEFWSAAWGMTAFILSIFFASAQWSVDNFKEAVEKTGKYKEQTSTLKKVFNDIIEIGEIITEAGQNLERTTLEAISSVNQLIFSNEKIIKHIENQLETVEKNSGAIETILESFNNISTFVDNQSSLVDKSSQSIMEIVNSISMVYKTTEETKSIAKNLVDFAETGKNMVNGAAKAINEIENSSENVKEIVKSIKGIAEETNILAMNAAIQAAHAGEYGRGFAIVANEVRVLSENSSSRAIEIEQHIHEMSERVLNGVKIFDNVKASLDKILEGITKTTELIDNIFNFSKTQYNMTTSIKENIDTLLKATQLLIEQTKKQKAESEKIKQSLKELKEVALGIEESINEQAKGEHQISFIIAKVREISEENTKIIEKLETLMNLTENAIK